MQSENPMYVRKMITRSIFDNKQFYVNVCRYIIIIQILNLQEKLKYAKFDVTLNDKASYFLIN